MNRLLPKAVFFNTAFGQDPKQALCQKIVFPDKNRFCPFRILSELAVIEID
jgi:hypothetical protein